MPLAGMPTLMRPVQALTLLALSLLAVVGCGASQSKPTTPRSRVAKDLGCTTAGTSVQELARVPGENAARWQVRGCGRTAVYVCTLPVRDCWREGEIHAE
jgi:hypothetical protein